MPHRDRKNLDTGKHRRRAWRGAALGLVLALFVPHVTAAGVDADEAQARQRGWGYVVDRLIADGVPRAKVAALFADRRIPPFDGLPFQLAPRESHARYTQLRSAPSRRAARLCRARYASAFDAAEAREGVPASLIAAIIHTESACGRSAGSSTVVHRLARLAMANDPDNVAANIRRHAGDPPNPNIAEHVHLRAAYLEQIFFPELRAVFTMADRLGIDPLALEGSGAGAFGYPQFLPTSYLRFGTDGNGDGRVSLYDMADAAASCARFLAANGWKRGLSLAERRQVIWNYNRSDAYIDTILVLQSDIAAASESRASVATQR